MAEFHRDGKFGLKQSYVMAAMLFEKAVAQGDPGAMCGLACLHREGQGVVQSFTKTIELFTMAVEKGDGNATFNLALMYRDGEGVVQSFKKAAELFTMAAEQGHVQAMTNLGIKYIQGQGVDQSNEFAREWLTKAANEGEEIAIKALKLLDKLEGKPKTASPTATAPPPSVCCSSCNKPQPSGHTFRKCMGCRTVQYCNKECQRAHWSPGGHKQECKRLRKKKEAKKGGSSSQNMKSKKGF
jgi:TPR repeat protein